MKKITIFMVVIFFMPAFFLVAQAGNRDMIENRLDELDKLNKEAVNRIAGKPESGIINIKVRAIPGKEGYRFEPIDKETSSSITETVLPRESDGKYFTFREGIARLAKKQPLITPYKNYGNEGENISFKEAIIRLNRSK